MDTWRWGGCPRFCSLLDDHLCYSYPHKLVRYITTTKARIMELKHVKTNLVFRKSLKSHEITIFFTFFLLVNSQLSSATSNAFAKARYSALSPTGDAESVAQSPAMKLRKPTRNRTFRRWKLGFNGSDLKGFYSFFQCFYGFYHR